MGSLLFAFLFLFVCLSLRVYGLLLLVSLMPLWHYRIAVTGP